LGSLLAPWGSTLAPFWVTGVSPGSPVGPRYTKVPKRCPNRAQLDSVCAPFWPQILISLLKTAKKQGPRRHPQKSVSRDQHPRVPMCVLYSKYHMFREVPRRPKLLLLTSFWGRFGCVVATTARFLRLPGRFWDAHIFVPCFVPPKGDQGVLSHRMCGGGPLIN